MIWRLLLKEAMTKMGLMSQADSRKPIWRFAKL
jgi:hypothetical protein